MPTFLQNVLSVLSAACFLISSYITAWAPEVPLSVRLNAAIFDTASANEGLHYVVVCLDGSTPRGGEYTSYLLSPALTALFGVCEKGYIVRWGPGGYEWLHASAANELLATKLKVIIDGQCYSGCAELADAARDKVEISTRAAFYFHQAWKAHVEKIDGRWKLSSIQEGAQHQSPDIDGWVLAQKGGYPAKGFTEMPYSVARRYWRTVISTEIAGASRTPVTKHEATAHGLY